MERRTFIRRTVTALVAAKLVTATTFALALNLQEAKKRGLVGEADSGYLGAVKTGDPKVDGLVKSINDKRRAAYQDIAKKRGTSLQAVEQLAGRKAIEKTPAGQYVRTGGQWRRK